MLDDLFRKESQIICRGRDARLSVEDGMPDYLQMKGCQMICRGRNVR
jgi:hypothetical protein